MSLTLSKLRLNNISGQIISIFDHSLGKKPKPKQINKQKPKPTQIPIPLIFKMGFSRFQLVSVGSVTVLLLLGSPELKQHSRCNFISAEQRGKITLLDLLAPLINRAQDTVCLGKACLKSDYYMALISLYWKPRTGNISPLYF